MSKKKQLKKARPKQVINYAWIDKNLNRNGNYTVCKSDVDSVVKYLAQMYDYRIVSANNYQIVLETDKEFNLVGFILWSLLFPIVGSFIYVIYYVGTNKPRYSLNIDSNMALKDREYMTETEKNDSKKIKNGTPFWPF